MDEILARLERIERRLDALEGAAWRRVPPPVPPPSVAAPVSNSTEELENAFGTRWLPRFGALAIVGAIAYLVGLGLQRGVVTSAAVAVGIAFACVATAVVGARMRGERETFGSVLVGLGAGGLYVDAVGAHLYHELLGGEATVASCVAISLATLAFGARRAVPAFLGIGAFGGLLASLMPLGKDALATATGLCLLVMASTFGVAALRRWPQAVIAAWAAGGLTSLVLLAAKGPLALRLLPLDAGLLMALAAWSSAAQVPSVWDLAGAFPLVAAALTGAAALAVDAGSPGAFHLVVLGLLVAGIGAIRPDETWRRTRLAGVGLASVVAPLALRPDQASAILAGLALVGAALVRFVPRLTGLRALAATQALVAVATYLVAWATLPHVPFETALIGLTVVSAVAVATAIDRAEARIVAGLVLWGMLSRLAAIHLALPFDTALTVAWIVAFAVLLVVGFVRRHPELRQLGLLVAVVTAAKVLLVDLSGLDPATKAGVLLGLGVVSLGGGYAYVRANAPRGHDSAP